MKAVVGMIEYGRETIRYEVRFLPSRQTLGIEVHPDRVAVFFERLWGASTVRAPLCPPLCGFVSVKANLNGPTISLRGRKVKSPLYPGARAATRAAPTWLEVISGSA